jgi:hypothetical protein
MSYIKFQISYLNKFSGVRKLIQGSISHVHEVWLIPMFIKSKRVESERLESQMEIKAEIQKGKT